MDLRQITTKLDMFPLFQGKLGYCLVRNAMDFNHVVIHTDALPAVVESKLVNMLLGYSCFADVEDGPYQTLTRCF